MFKIVAISAFLAVAATAAPIDGHATSFVSFNDNHNSVQHVQSAPAYPAKYAAAPAYTTKYAAPAAPAASYYAAAPAAAPAPQYVTKLAALPVLSKKSYAAAVPVAKYSPYHGAEEEYGPANYEFAYVIEDPHTGDYHSQEEKSDGHHVVGQYSLHEADGTIRIVKYSDEGHGFNAIVEKQGQPAAPAYKKY